MKKLAILYLEDNRMDVEIVESYLEEEKIEYELTNVDNRSDFISVLKKKQFDIILLDYSLPSFDGLSALAIVKKSYPDIPAMMISGVMGEEQAIETLKAGATDYVLKQKMFRFIPSLRRAIEEAEEQRKRKRAEEQLRESERKYHNLIENAVDLIQEVGPNGKFLLVNKKWLETLEYSKEEVKDLMVTDILREDQIARIMGLLQGVAKGKKVIGIKTIFITKNGKEIYVEGNRSGIFEDNKFSSAIGIFRDITERKKAEEALKKSEEKYRLMIESSRDAIVISQNDKFIFFNDAFTKMLDYDMEHLESLNYTDIYTEKAVNELEERKRLLDKGEDISHRYETVFKKKDRSEIDVEAHVTIIDYNGEKATFAVIRDITKQKEIFKVLQRSAEQTRGLKEFIPICAGCNKIRDDENENKPWISPAEYIRDRLPDINFSHGMCPDCMKKWYPDFVNRKKVGKLGKVSG